MTRLLIALAALTATIHIASAAPNGEIAAACRDGRINAPKILSFWKQQRVVRNLRGDADSVVVDVDSRRWRTIGHDAQVTIGVAAYCTIAKNGLGTAIVKGSDQEQLGSVVDGNFFQ